MQSASHVFANGMNLHARFCSGTAPATIVKEPFCRPETPKPATARPTMKKGDEVATAQSSEPSSKTNRNARKVHLVWKYVYILPVRGCKTELRKRAR